MQESARFALDFMSRAVQQAGYKGCFSKNDDVYYTMDDDDDIPYEWDIRQGLVGYESMVGGNWCTTSACGLTVFDTPYITGNQIDTSTVLVGTDVLTLRYISYDKDFNSMFHIRSRTT